MKQVTQEGEFDRSAEDLSNLVEFGHVNITIPSQLVATDFYVSALGLTRDPYLVTGTENMWINVGREQFHLPTGRPQVLRGVIGLVLPDREFLLSRLAAVAPLLEGSLFRYAESDDGVDVTCPWGNRVRCHEPNDVRFGPIVLGMPYVELDVPPGTLPGIVRFYREIMGGIAGENIDAKGPYAWADVGRTNRIHFREAASLPDYDGHHIQISLMDFSGPYKRLRERGLVFEESNQHQYRFLDVVDPASNERLFQLEHELRSMRHPMFGRELVNRNPQITNVKYAPEHQMARFALPPLRANL